MSKNVYHIGSGALTFEIIERIINENLKLELAPEAKLRIQKCRDYLDHKIASSEEPLYGITTGFGSLCTKNISPDELGTLQENLIKSHACSVGEEIRPVIIKLMMTGRISSPTLQAWLFIRFSCKVPNSPGDIFLVHNEPKPVVMP